MSQKIDFKTIDKNTAVVVATGNPHKVQEIEAILAPVMPGVTFYALGELDLPGYVDPEEDGLTFTDNARIKAAAAHLACNMAAIADDSGLVVDALDGEPGVFSARWAGEHGNDAANNAKLMAAMAGVPEPLRTARFHSAVVLIDADGHELIGEGDCEGMIGFEPKGTGGFGYDPLFVPDATAPLTMAELAPQQKNELSHRAFALHALAAQL